MTTVIAWAPWLLGLAALASFVAAVLAFRGRRPLSGVLSLLSGSLWLALAALIALLDVGLVGYRALTHEDVALTVLVTPLAGQQFLADVRFPGGRAESWTLAGDELYVDARILKWKGVATLLGLHTVYELDRIGGRYRDLAQERSSPRTVYPLGAEKRFDLFGWIQRKTWMAPLVDAEYGSGTFIDVRESAIYEVRVSTTGLLIRKVPSP